VRELAGEDQRPVVSGPELLGSLRAEIPWGTGGGTIRAFATSPSHLTHGEMRVPAWLQVVEWPREESNLRTRIRSPLLYPLSYGAAGYEA
jgi:hypothetical protein